jgi:hypothetical protein
MCVGWQIAIVLGNHFALQWLSRVNTLIDKHTLSSTTASAASSTDIAKGSEAGGGGSMALVVVLHSSLHTKQFHSQVQVNAIVHIDMILLC